MALDFVGLDSLDEGEIRKLTSSSERFYSKAVRMSNDPRVIVHVKKMKTGGKRCKYSVHGRVEAPTLIASANFSDWDLTRTLNKTFEKIENEIEHKYRTEGKTGRVSFKHDLK